MLDYRRTLSPCSSVVTVWRGWLTFLGITTDRISPGVQTTALVTGGPTEKQFSQRLLVAFFCCSVESVLTAVSMPVSGLPVAQLQTEKHSKESSALLRRPMAALSPHCKNRTIPAALKKPRTY